jgi:PmbA protein
MITAHSSPHPSLYDDDEAVLSALELVLTKARRAGAENVDALMIARRSLAVGCRLGLPETVEHAESRDIGVRVLIGHRQALASTSDLSDASLQHVVEQAVAMARAAPEDPYCGLADPEQLARETVDVEGVDASEPAPEAMADRARTAEDAARQVAGIVNSEGAECGWEAETVAVAATNGFARMFRRSRHSINVSVVAGDGQGLERDYEYAMAVFGSDLPDPAVIGASAGEKAAKRLGPRKIDTGRFPVVYAPRVARSVLGHLAGAISGSAVTRKTTFLADRLGQRIFPAAITIADDPLRKRGLRSRPFDAEGLPAHRLNVVEDGVLRCWLLDLSSARQLGLETTGRASRGVSSPPSPSATNLYIQSGDIDAACLIGDVAAGLYVTDLIGMGVNGVTGDYSRGAAGFWIHDGQLDFPVSEVTVSGNLIDMFANMTAANDLEFRYGFDSPTLRIDGMTVAGR